MANEITIFRGDNADIRCTVVDKDGVAVNITGASIKFTVRNPQSGEQIFQLTSAAGTVVITNGAGGICEARCVPGATGELEPGEYVYDFEFTIATKVFTIKGTLTSTKDVTYT